MHEIEEIIDEVGKRNHNAPNHWELLDLNNLQFDKPTVLCLCGNATTTNKIANGFAKQAETYLDLMFAPKQDYHTLDHVDIISVKYNQAGTLNIRTKDLLTDALCALLVDQNGQRLDLETAKKNMSRVCYFTFCGGNKELQSLINQLNEKLVKLGYKNEEIYAINNASLEVAYAPQSVIYNRIPSVRIISKKDEVNSFVHFMALEAGGVLTQEQMQNLDGIYLHEDKPGSLNGIKNDISTPYLVDFPADTTTAGSIQIISSGLLNTYDGRFDEHSVKITARDQDWQINPIVINDVAYHSPNADCVSQMMAWALCKGVENGIQNFTSKKYIPNTYWNEMMDDLQSIINSYEQQKLSRKQAQQETDLEK